MAKRGAKPKGKVVIKWSSNFAYAIGLIATDGNLSKNGRSITMTSKDIEQLINCMTALNITVPLGYTISGATHRKTARIQFSDTLFHSFLVSIGVFPNKSKTLGVIKIPHEYFFDLLRGCFDGDGTVYSYFDTRWQSSFLCYTAFTSASRAHVEWLRHEICERTGEAGHISKSRTSSVYQLRYGKTASRTLWKNMYKKRAAISLSRKRLKIKKITRIIDGRQ